MLSIDLSFAIFKSSLCCLFLCGILCFLCAIFSWFYKFLSNKLSRSTEWSSEPKIVYLILFKCKDLNKKKSKTVSPASDRILINCLFLLLYMNNRYTLYLILFSDVWIVIFFSQIWSENSEYRIKYCGHSLDAGIFVSFFLSLSLFRSLPWNMYEFVENESLAYYYGHGCMIYLLCIAFVCDFGQTHSLSINCADRNNWELSNCNKNMAKPCRYSIFFLCEIDGYLVEPKNGIFRTIIRCTSNDNKFLPLCKMFH